MDSPEDLPHALRRTFDAWWYRQRYPLRTPGPRARWHARSLATSERSGSEAPLRASDLASLATDTRGTERFLGIYGADGMLTALRAHGILDGLARRGFTRVGVEFDLRDPFEHTARVYDGDPSRRLGELVASRKHAERIGPVELACEREVISIAWLSIEDPDAPTGKPSERLPGQSRPGIGLFRAVMEMSLAGAEHLGFAAMMAVPAHYHLAWMYHPWFRAVDPVEEGALLALRHTTRTLTRKDASWAIERSEVRFDGAPWRWKAPVMCAPFDGELRDWFTSMEYARAVVEAADERRARFVHERAERET